MADEFVLCWNLKKDVFLWNNQQFINLIRTKNVCYDNTNIFCTIMYLEKWFISVIIQDGCHKNERNIEFMCATFSNLTTNDIL